eukprot:CAMPEP_0181313350 /NCGR_PEP_ID=MMETSP1101-20121128/14201_1 /TAXON_ID=46948 /ORGANISM="Rhodomonas abbreviata, Strain Caron Lab Isolate" /LENGTH=302 /DNA_ID=CAMNT_0023420297 /DNA_START=168 /DNA_END=1074 /DNA_ORIENTATION=-
MSHLRLRLRPHTSSHSSSSAQTHLTPPTHCLTAPTPSSDQTHLTSSDTSHTSDSAQTVLKPPPPRHRLQASPIPLHQPRCRSILPLIVLQAQLEPPSPAQRPRPPPPSLTQASPLTSPGLQPSVSQQPRPRAGPASPYHVPELEWQQRRPKLGASARLGLGGGWAPAGARRNLNEREATVGHDHERSWGGGGGHERRSMRSTDFGAEAGGWDVEGLEEEGVVLELRGLLAAASSSLSSSSLELSSFFFFLLFLSFLSFLAFLSCLSAAFFFRGSSSSSDSDSSHLSRSTSVFAQGMLRLFLI